LRKHDPSFYFVITRTALIAALIKEILSQRNKIIGWFRLYQSWTKVTTIAANPPNFLSHPLSTFAGILPTAKGYSGERRVREIHFNRTNPSENRAWQKAVFIYFFLPNAISYAGISLVRYIMWTSNGSKLSLTQDV